MTATIDIQHNDWPVRTLLLVFAIVVAVAILVVSANWASTSSSAKAGSRPSLTTQPTTECVARIHTFEACATF